MLKHVILVVASAGLGAACGIQNLDALGGEADVEIVNADASNAADGEDTEADGFSSLGSAGDDADGADDPADDETDSPAPDTGDADDEQPISAPPSPNSAGIIEVADQTMVALVGTEDRMTLNPEKPTGGWGYLTVDRAYTTAMVDDVPASTGNKFVAVEYQMLAANNGNFFDQTFRLLADGKTYSPANNINEIGSAAAVFNDVVFFEVPLDTGDVQLEGGAVSGSSDGFTAVYDIGFRPAEPADVPPASLPDDQLNAIVGDIQLTSDDARMTMDTSQPTGGWGTLTLHGGMATAKIEDTSAGPGFKFLVLDVQVLGQERDNLFDEAFRVEADGELYQTLTGVNEVLAPGQVYNSALVFRVPQETSDFVLEAGMPERWTDGLRATVSFSLWDPSEGVTESEAGTDVAVEAEATSITLVGDEQRMTTDPSDARGWGTLTLDRAYTTAKIEQDGARDGYKYLVIEYQLLGGERDNFFDEALRLETNGELYSPLTGINEIVAPGEVFNGAVVFEIPLSAVEIRFEGGAVPGSTDGFITNYNISFG